VSKKLEQFKSFDITSSSVAVWAFKKSVREGSPVFTGRWVEITKTVDEALRAALSDARDAISETIEYSLLAQNNEGSALAISANETYAPVVTAQALDPTPKRRVKSLKEIANAKFYAVKFVSGEDVVYAVRTTDASWRTRTATGMFSVVFVDQKLELDDRPRFSISRHFDFFIVGDQVLVLKKGAFESLLDYKAAHISDYSDLKEEAEFTSLFTDVTPLNDFVGTNKINLRRASAIRQKAHYKDIEFMKRLRANASAMGFGINFDVSGKIVPSADTCRDIFTALLDFRLDSRLSERTYDVENTSAVTLPSG